MVKKTVAELAAEMAANGSGPVTMDMTAKSKTTVAAATATAEAPEPDEPEQEQEQEPTTAAPLAAPAAVLVPAQGAEPAGPAGARHVEAPSHRVPAGMERKDVPFWIDQLDDVELLAKRLNRQRGRGIGERITYAMLVRVATDALLQLGPHLQGTTEAEIRRSYLTQLGLDPEQKYPAS